MKSRLVVQPAPRFGLAGHFVASSRCELGSLNHCSLIVAVATADETGLEDQVVGKPAGLHHSRAGESDLAGGPRVVDVDAAHPKHQTLDEVGAGPSAPSPDSKPKHHGVPPSATI